MCNTAAMTPLAHVAGMAAAVLGTLSTGLGALLGSLVDGAFDGTVRPYGIATFVFAAVASATILLGAGPVPAAEIRRGRTTSPSPRCDPAQGRNASGRLVSRAGWRTIRYADSTHSQT